MFPGRLLMLKDELMMVLRMLFVLLSMGCLFPSSWSLAGEVVVERYAPKSGSFAACTHLLIGDKYEIVTAGSRLLYRADSSKPFRESPLKGLKDAHAVAFNRRDRLFYVTDTGNHQLRTFRDPASEKWNERVNLLAGEKLDRPHDIVVDEKTGWMYALNPNNGFVFRFRSVKEEATKLDLSKHLGYSRALTIVKGKLYLIGSSRGVVIEVDDFAKKKFTIHQSFGKKKDAVAGSWKATGLVLNDVDYFKGYWYATSYFCPTYAGGEDCNENKFIRFKTWQDFQTGNWEDLSQKLPKDIVPYFLTPTEQSLYIAVFNHEKPKAFNKVFRLEISNQF